MVSPAIAFAREGADVVICYHSNKAGAEQTQQEVHKFNRRGIILQVDVSEERK